MGQQGFWTCSSYIVRVLWAFELGFKSTHLDKPVSNHGFAASIDLWMLKTVIRLSEIGVVACFPVWTSSLYFIHYL